MENYFEPSTINERFNELLSHLKLSQTAFAKKLGTSATRISNIVKLRNKPDSQLLSDIIEQYPQISSKWLLTGRGDMLENVKISGKLEQEFFSDSASGNTAQRTPSYTPPDTPNHRSLQKKSGKNTVKDNAQKGSERQNNLLKADTIHSTVDAAAIGGEAAQRWGARRITEGKLYKRYPQAESATLSDYMLFGGLGQYIDTMLVELRRTVQSQVDAVLDQSIDGEITMPQAAEKIQEITKPLNNLQGAIEGFENSMFGLVAATVEQYPSLLTLVKGTPLYFSLEEWLENSADNEISVKA